MTRVILLCILLGITARGAAQTSLREHNESLFQQLQQIHGLSDEQMHHIRAIFAHSSVLSQGNPFLSKHPVTPQQCAALLEKQSVHYGNPQFEQICGGKFMAPLFDPKATTAERAKACIDQFEFPDIPCAYPVVWVKRLYVRPAFRGLGLGRQLVEAAMDAARQGGYASVLLDTLNDMEAARALYTDLGFHEIPPYYHNPIPGAHYLEADI